jgi:hypothetical protein
VLVQDPPTRYWRTDEVGKQRQHPVLVEVTTERVGVLRIQHLKLVACERGFHVDARRTQTADVIRVRARDDVHAALAVVETRLHEGDHGAVLVRGSDEECADVPAVPTRGAVGDLHWQPAAHSQ